MINQDIEDILKGDKLFKARQQADKNDRYWSWEHCYSVFTQHKSSEITDEDIDYLCLHLAFYLASWGMYRGSSKLLQKDYKVHAAAVKKLMREEYIDLWAVKCEELNSPSDKLEKLFILSNALREIYYSIGVTPTDTLITKILMGTLGCAPAYDRYFVDGVRGRKGASLTFNMKSMQELSNFYVNHSDYFEEWRKSFSTGNVEYPQMKVLDMCFLLRGYEVEAAWKEAQGVAN